jgi:inosine/xanthosine triphosphatase
MKKVIIASKNPVKINCVQEVIAVAFPLDHFDFDGVSVPSEVNDQPMTDDETLQGALNRASNAKKEFEGEYHIGIEGGLSDDGKVMTAFAWVVVLRQDKVGKARTSTFELPQKIAELVREGVELGHADDMVFKRENSKQKDGAVGILTNGILDRTEYYKQAVLLALVPMLNEELY